MLPYFKKFGIESLPQTLISNHNIYTTQCFSAQIFKTTNCLGSNNKSSKYQRFTPSGCRDIGVRKFQFVTKTHFLFFSAFFLHEKLKQKLKKHFEIGFSANQNFCENFRSYFLNFFLRNISFEQMRKRCQILQITISQNE